MEWIFLALVDLTLDNDHLRNAMDRRRECARVVRSRGFKVAVILPSSNAYSEMSNWLQINQMS